VVLHGGGELRSCEAGVKKVTAHLEADLAGFFCFLGEAGLLLLNVQDSARGFKIWMDGRRRGGWGVGGWFCHLNCSLF
jgi:hypothetical protein